MNVMNVENIMTKTQFLHLLEQIMYENPEWLSDVISTANDGILRKIKDERKVSTNIQVSLEMLYEKQYNKLDKKNKQKVLEAILECEITQDTPFAKEVGKRLQSIKDK